MTNLRYGKENWHSFEQGIQKEWLVTNGLGGYASSTIINANIRKYHGLLVAALNPPVERTLLVSKVDERVEVEGKTYNLATNQTVKGVTEFGFIHQQAMTVKPVPCFTYSFRDILIEKRIFMVHGKNTTVLLYHIQNGADELQCTFEPLVNYRDFHWTVHHGQINVATRIKDGGVGVQCTLGGAAGVGVPHLTIMSNQGQYVPREDWFLGMYYQAEEERGENPVEDHYIPGKFIVSCAPFEEKTITLLLSANISDETEGFMSDGNILMQEEISRQEHLLQKAGFCDDYSKPLVLAADAFVVWRESTRTKSVIAGYHWFNDWGRDTMIALPGLTLVTGRFADAADILLTFAQYCKDGLLPNMFPDQAGQEPLYNTVDASLWYFHAVYKYLQYTGDFDFVMEQIYPVLQEIIRWHIHGTQYQIKMTEDGLLQAGGPENQLTWMDAKVDHWVVTPRHGKPVEISALWYNALRVMETLANQGGKDFAFQGLAAKVKDSFEREFWYTKGGYYYDVLQPNGVKDAHFRPNQVLAMGLPFSPVAPERAREALQKVWSQLYATYGLRSLSLYDPDYQGVYQGDRVKRDGAYHQGTVWSWLMGPFVTAYRKAYGYGPRDRKQAAIFLAPFQEHIRDHGIGYVSEIFDGNEPIKPRGSIAQAWGVAEVLRAYVEDVLEIRNWKWDLPQEGENEYGLFTTS